MGVAKAVVWIDLALRNQYKSLPTLTAKQQLTEQDKDNARASFTIHEQTCYKNVSSVLKDPELQTTMHHIGVMHYNPANYAWCPHSSTHSISDSLHVLD